MRSWGRYKCYLEHHASFAGVGILFKKMVSKCFTLSPEINDTSFAGVGILFKKRWRSVSFCSEMNSVNAQSSPSSAYTIYVVCYTQY